MAEWTMAAVLKTVGGGSLPWVRILLPPPFYYLISCAIVIACESSCKVAGDAMAPFGGGELAR